MEGPRQVPIGMFSRSVSRRLFTRLECAKLSLRQNCPALVRTTGTHSGVRNGRRFAPMVRNPLREAGANLDGLPAIKSYGCQPLVSTVVSTVWQCFSLTERRFAKTTP